MKPRNPSPKLERAIEDYLISSGSSRECLTQKQFQVVTKYVKIWRANPYVVVALLALAVLEVLLIIWVCRMANSLVDSTIPKDTHEVILTSLAGEERTVPITVKTTFLIIGILGWMCGLFTAKLIWFLTEVFLGLRLRNRMQREVLGCFLPKTQNISAVY